MENFSNKPTRLSTIYKSVFALSFKGGKGKIPRSIKESVDGKSICP